MLNRQQRLYRNCKKHGFKNEDKVRVEAFRQECNTAIKKSKEGYYSNIGNKLNTSQNFYWELINRVINRCKAPKIPPILVNNVSVFNAKDEATEFIKYFSNQCKLLVNCSTLPNFSYLTNDIQSHLLFTEICPTTKSSSFKKIHSKVFHI